MATRGSSLSSAQSAVVRISLFGLCAAAAACDSIELGQSSTNGSASIGSLFSIGHMREIDDQLSLFDFLEISEAPLEDAGATLRDPENEAVCVLPPLDESGTLLVHLATQNFTQVAPGACLTTTQSCGQVRVSAETPNGNLRFSGVSDRATVPLAIGAFRGELNLTAELVLDLGSATCSGCSLSIRVSDDCNLSGILTANPPPALPTVPAPVRDAGAIDLDAAAQADAAAVPDTGAPKDASMGVADSAGSDSGTSSLDANAPVADASGDGG